MFAVSIFRPRLLQFNVLELLRAALVTLSLIVAVGPLAGCAEFTQFKQTVSNVAAAVTSAKINRKAVFVAASTANGFIVSADLYLQQPICGKMPCRNPAATEAIIDAVTALRSTRTTMLAFMKAHPAELGDKGLYDAMVAATGEMQKIFAIYGIGS